MKHHFEQEWRDIVYELHRTNPQLLNRIGRKFMNFLYRRNPERIDTLLRNWFSDGKRDTPGAAQSENQPKPRIDFLQLEKIIDELFRIAADELSEEEIGHMLNLWLKSEQSRVLLKSAEKRDVQLGVITAAVNSFSNLPDAQKSLSPEERLGVRVNLIRRFLSEDLEYVNTMKHIVGISDFTRMLSRVIGPQEGNGKLGGKAAGLFRAEKIIREAKAHGRIAGNVCVPETWYITSDGILDFLHFNALEEMAAMKYRDASEIRQEYPYIEQIFKNSTLTPELLADLAKVVDHCVDKPLVVRSSSLLEDLQGSAFAGKYKSLFVANRGTREQRLDSLADAVIEVYASVFGPDPIEYRRQRGLLDFNEEMAIMIQEVVGTRVGKYYFPAFAGVAMSYNEYRMSPRIRRTDGLARMVAGLGTRAVDRTDEDYPMLVSPGQPGLRPQNNPQDMFRYSQKKIDLINLDAGRFESIPVGDLLKEIGTDYPILSQIVSMYREGHFFDPVSSYFDLSDGMPAITFANLVNRSPFIPHLRTVMTLLEETLGWPVDIEFAAGSDVNSLYLLQCRPQSHLGRNIRISIPADIPDADKIFTAGKFVTSGLIEHIEYIVYVDPFEYDGLSTMEDLLYIGRIVGKLNAILPYQRFILMGPGRWGSRGDIKLGVRVGYSDINNSAMLIEIAREKKGYVPELSFGTHFFQDLVESKILYLPLYPDEPGNIFNEEFFRNSRNHLRNFLPEAERLETAIRVIDMGDAAPGASLSIVMDGEREKAMAYVKRYRRAVKSEE